MIYTIAARAISVQNIIPPFGIDVNVLFFRKPLFYIFS